METRLARLLTIAREKKLDRVGAAYAVTAWVIVQAASVAFSAFEMPASSMRWLLFALLTGFPLTLIWVWFAARRADGAKDNTEPTLTPVAIRDWLPFSIAGVAAVFLGIQALTGFSLHRQTTSPAKVSQASNAPSIAVLPFVNLSGDPKKVYFSDGIADQLISELARTPALRVAARSSSFAFRDRNIDVKAIAKALSVRAVLEGSVREDGERVRIVAELVDAKSGFQIWSDSYDRSLSNILALQDDIAHAITEAVARKFLGHAIVVAKTRPQPQTIDPEAYKLYLQGQYYYAQRTRESLLRAMDFLRQATERAPQFADAFATLADAQSTAAMNYQMPGSEAASLKTVGQALALDPDNPTALIARATLELLRWQWRAAGADIRRLEQLHVNSAAAWHMRALFFDYMGLVQYCGAAAERAAQLDPLSFIDRFNLALYRKRQGKFDEAERVARQVLAMQPSNPDILDLSLQIALGRHDIKRAEQLLAMLIAKTGETSPYVAESKFYIFVAKKDLKSAHDLMDNVAKLFPASGFPANDIATAYAMIGDMDSALDWYRRALDLHEAQFLAVQYTNPVSDKLYADPRWKALREEPAVKDWEAARSDIAAQFAAGG